MYQEKTVLKKLARLHDKEIISHLDIHFSRFMMSLSNPNINELALGAALVSSFTRQGHVCLDIGSMGGSQLLGDEDGEEAVFCPEADDWCLKLSDCHVVGKPGQFRPMILDERSRLYLFRYWDYQDKLADLIRKRVCKDDKDIDTLFFKKKMDQFFPEEKKNCIDWQKVASFIALIKHFCVISGGPGTGKTTTIAKIMALILEQAKPHQPLIALAAPTGKAAARLQESIKQVKAGLDCPVSIKQAIPEEASTLHRLLGSVHGTPHFRYNAGNPLPFDVVIIDEASMVDMALMSKLVQALDSQSRLILFGDKDQLASVEAGAVLGDICDSSNTFGFSKSFCEKVKEISGYDIYSEEQNRNNGCAIRDCIIQLHENYRFDRKSGISAVSKAVNAGDDNQAIELLTIKDYKDIRMRQLPGYRSLAKAVRNMIIQGFDEYLKAADPLLIFQLFDRFRILCAIKDGPYGVTAINSTVERILAGEKLINPTGPWYSGRPILITRNDYNLQLFNGDVGIILPDPEVDNELRTFFPDSEGNFKKFHPLRLPEHETSYAMTIHKSQGAEFDTVLLLLPDRDLSVLTRELIYTGITRAREKVEIWSHEEVLRTAVLRRTERMSGLKDILWNYYR